MPIFLRCAVALFLLLPTLSAAQTYPTRSETAVTDDAGLIDPVAEAELATRLTQLGQDNDAELAVVTLPSMALYTAGEDIDVYARNLVEAWSLGGTTSDRGVLLLVFAEDRELRIELGAGFGAEAQGAARSIVEDTITPEFREDDYAGGIAAGVEAIGAQLLPVATQTAPAEEVAPANDAAAVAEADPAGEGAEGGGSGVLLWIGAGIAAVVALVVGSNRRAAARLAATPCPACGKTGLTRSRVTLVPATETQAGRGEVRTTCPHCGHVEADPFEVPRLDPATPGKDAKAASLAGGALGAMTTPTGGPAVRSNAARPAEAAPKAAGRHRKGENIDVEEAVSEGKTAGRRKHREASDDDQPKADAADGTADETKPAGGGGASGSW